MSTVFRPQADNWQGLLKLVREGGEWHTRTNSFSGKRNDPESAVLPSRGWMSVASYNTLERRHKMYGIDFVVRSYDTVIAYRLTNGQWHVPSDRYSRATSKHQGLIMTVIGVMGAKAA